MKSLRARAMLKSLGFIKKANGHYVKNEECTWCEGLDSTDCWVCQGSGESTSWLILDQFKEVIRDSGYHTTVAPCEHCGEVTQIDYDYWCCGGYLCECMGERISYAVCNTCKECVNKGETV
ncbi:hypothetical protein N374_gp195 [Bacillus phage phiNIT1]|uniref:Uncharacterized protein n=1 Tax=Bacillus phage phiNIT1 TaxID=207656 RepID=S6B6F5_9CAUD|nr:hypothetical protein N374_gp195 [Bacillus phage phiNIT1]BAN59672.1 hypothetical protein [Bacillus phage phiNIT1]